MESFENFLKEVQITSKFMGRKTIQHPQTLIKWNLKRQRDSILPHVNLNEMSSYSRGFRQPGSKVKATFGRLRGCGLIEGTMSLKDELQQFKHSCHLSWLCPYAGSTLIYTYHCTAFRPGRVLFPISVFQPYALMINT